MFVTRQALTKMPDNDGTLSPITSSSGQQVEEPDNSVEYYVKASQQESEYVSAADNNRKENCGTCKFFIKAEEACTVVSGRIEEKAYCKLYIEGGEKMTDKGLDVDASATVDTSYTAGHGTTEPDPESELAMQKGATYTKPAELDGVGNYSTTANSSVDAPDSGETTEPESVHKAAGCSCTCEHCVKCAGMMKAAGCDCCSDCGPNCGGDCCGDCSMTTKSEEADDLEKAADSEEEKDEPAPDVEELEKTVEPETQKSLWNNAFAPGVPNAAIRTVFRQD